MNEREHFSYQKIIQSGEQPDPDTAAQMALHLESCSECREFAAFHAYLDQSLPDLVPAAGLTPQALREKTAFIIYRHRSRQMIASTLQTSHKLGLAAALVIVLVLGLSWAVKTLIPGPVPGVVSATTPTPAGTALPQPTGSPQPSATLAPTEKSELPQPVLIAQLNRGEILRFALSPGGEWIAASTNNQVCLFLTAGFVELWCSASDLMAGSGASSLSFSPDEEYIAAGLNSGRILIFARENGEQGTELADLRGTVRSLAWSPDGRWLAYGSDSKFVHIWNPQTGESLPRLAADNSNSMALAWSPDGTRLAAATYFGSIFVWETSGFEVIFSSTADDPLPFSAIAWAPDGKTLYTTSFAPYGCGEGCNPAYVGWVQAWDAGSGEQRYKVEVGDPLASLAVSPDGQWVAAGGEVFGQVVVLDARTGSEIAERSDTRARTGLAWIDAERLLFAANQPSGGDQVLEIWNTSSGVLSEMILPGYTSFTGMSWLPESTQLLVSSAGGELSLWQGQNGLMERDLGALIEPILEARITAEAISPDGIYLAIPTSGSILIYNITTGQQTSTDTMFALPEGASAYNLKWSPDGKLLAGITSNPGEEQDSDGSLSWIWDVTAYVWDARTGEPIWNLPAGDGRSGFTGLAWSHDDNQLALGWYRNERQRLVIWDVMENTLIQELERAWIGEIWWPESDKLLLHSGGQVDVLNPQTFETQEQFNTANASGLSAHGALLAAGYGNTVFISHIENMNQRLVTLPVYAGMIQQVLFSPDGNLLAVFTEAGIISLWDVSELRRALPGH